MNSCRRKLSARKFCPVVGPEVLDSASQVPGKQVVHFNAQNSGKHEKLQVRNSTALVLQTGDRFAAGVPPEELQFDRKVRLRPSLAQTPLAHLRSDHVQVCGAVFDAATVSAADFLSGKPYEPYPSKIFSKMACNFRADWPKICMLERHTVPLIRSMRVSTRELPPQPRLSTCPQDQAFAFYMSFPY